MSDTQQWVAYDFLADQGSEWRRYIRFWQDEAKTLPVDFSGFTIDMHLREGVADSGAALVEQLSTTDTSDEPQRIFFIGMNSDEEPDPEAAADPSNGWIMLLLSDEETAAIAPSKLPKKRAFPATATFYYDIEITSPGGITQRRMAGEWVLSLEVTRL